MKSLKVTEKSGRNQGWEGTGGFGHWVRESEFVLRVLRSHGRKRIFRKLILAAMWRMKGREQHEKPGWRLLQQNGSLAALSRGRVDWRAQWCPRAAVPSAKAGQLTSTAVHSLTVPPKSRC